MKRWLVIGCLLLTLTSFGWHAFYVSIYQIQYAPGKKKLHITSRIFADDLNDALAKKYHQKTFLGEQNQSQNDVGLMAQYLIGHLSVKVNGKSQPLQYIGHEFENNVVICYFTASSTTKPRTLEVQSTALFEMFSDQQNIIQGNVLGKKQNLLLTRDRKSGVLKWE